MVTFYSRNREKCLAYQHQYNALHKTERKEYDRLRHLKRKAARQILQPPAIQIFTIEQNVRVDFN